MAVKMFVFSLLLVSTVSNSAASLLLALLRSLLKTSSILERRLKSRARGSNKLLEGTSALHDNVKIIKKAGLRMAKFCHVEVLLQM
jgi:hypothetical protein